MDPVYGTVNRLSSEHCDRWSGWRLTSNRQRPCNHAQELSDDRESETRSHEVRVLLGFPMPWAFAAENANDVGEVVCSKPEAQAKGIDG